ncbi:unnamed protein product [Calypogeia fissa]
MLPIGAHLHQQQGQWGLMTSGHLGERLPLERQRVGLEFAACERKSVCWNRSFRSGGRIVDDNTLRSRSRTGRRKRLVIGENSGMEEKAIDATALEKLVVGEAGATRSSTFNSKINNASKWMVVGLVTAGLLWRRDNHAVWFAVGSVVNGGFCKCLKYLINENRPSTADGVKADPGMPSSHAQGFFYIASYTSLALLLWQGINVWTSISSLGILLSFAYLSWLRVAEGLHTVPQVLVGSTLGSAAGAFWLYIWKAGAEVAVDSSVTAKFFLYMSFLGACVVCYFISFKDWEFGQP